MGKNKSPDVSEYWKTEPSDRKGFIGGLTDAELRRELLRAKDALERSRGGFSNPLVTPILPFLAVFFPLVILYLAAAVSVLDLEGQKWVEITLGWAKYFYGSLLVVAVLSFAGTAIFRERRGMVAFRWVLALEDEKAVREKGAASHRGRSKAAPFAFVGIVGGLMLRRARSLRRR